MLCIHILTQTARLSNLATILNERHYSDLLGLGGQYSLGNPSLLHLYRSCLLQTVRDVEQYKSAESGGTEGKQRGKPVYLLCSLVYSQQQFSWRQHFWRHCVTQHPEGYSYFIFKKTSYKTYPGVGNISFFRVTSCCCDCAVCARATMTSIDDFKKLQREYSYLEQNRKVILSPNPLATIWLSLFVGGFVWFFQ